MPGFPTVPITDDFNRADGGLGADWTTIAGSAAVASNQWAPTSGVNDATYHNVASFGSTAEVSARLAVVDGLMSVGLVNPGTFSGYVFGRASGNLVINRFDGGVPTNLATVATTVSAGDRIRFTFNGTEVEGWHSTTPGVWTLIANPTDNTYRTTLSGLLLVSSSTTARFDHFAVGAQVTVPFTEVNDTIGADDVLILTPTGAPNGRGIIFHQGLGGNEQQILAFMEYGVLFSLATAGYTLAASELVDGAQWGNTASVSAAEALAAELRDSYGVTALALVGGSAGGHSGLMQYLTGSALPIRGFAGTSVSVSLADIYADDPLGGTIVSDSIDAAFNIPGGGSYATQTAGRDPLLRTATDWIGKRLRFYASNTDTIVDRAKHADALSTVATGYATEAGVVTITGAHAEAAPDVADLEDFLERAFTVLNQEGYRFFDDDGDEDGSTGLASQDTPITRAKNTPTRLRILVDAASDPAGKQFRLEYRVAGSADPWKTVN